MPKFQFKEFEVISHLHTIEAPNLVEAIQQYDEKREDFRYGIGGGSVEHTYYHGPAPVCDNCGEPQCRTFNIPCCKAPNFPHSRTDIILMRDIALEEEP